MNNIFELSENGQTLLKCLDKNIVEATIPNGVTIIGEYAFFECSSLQSIVIPDSVILIEWNAFDRCTALQSIVIPKSVLKIESHAFVICI